MGEGDEGDKGVGDEGKGVVRVDMGREGEGELLQAKGAGEGAGEKVGVSESRGLWVDAPIVAFGTAAGAGMGALVGAVLGGAGVGAGVGATDEVEGVRVEEVGA